MYALKWNPLFFIVMNLFNCKKFSNDYKPEACRCVLCQKEWIEMLETIVPAFTAPSVMGFSLYDQSRTLYQNKEFERKQQHAVLF